MKLADVEHKIQTGDVLCFRGTALYARFIEWWTRSVYSHVGIVVRIECGEIERLCILEALEPRGVRLYPLDRYLAECTKSGIIVDWYAVVDPAINRERIAAYCLRQWGKRYASPWQLFFSFTWLGNLCRQVIGLPTRIDVDRFFCSAECAAAFEYAGYEPDEALEPVLNDPGAVSRFTCNKRMGQIAL